MAARANLSKRRFPSAQDYNIQSFRAILLRMNNAIEVFRGFLPPRRRGLRGAIERLLRVQVEGDDPSYREIYNPDRTRKFIFSESNDDENLSQLNIRLEVQVGISWVEFMGAMWRREDGKEHAYCIEIEARTLREECCEHMLACGEPRSMSISISYHQKQIPLSFMKTHYLNISILKVRHYGFFDKREI